MDEPSIEISNVFNLYLQITFHFQMSYLKPPFRVLSDEREGAPVGVCTASRVRNVFVARTFIFGGYGRVVQDTHCGGIAAIAL